MRQNNSDIKPSWLLMLRLTTYVIISGVVIFGLDYPSFLIFFFFAYSFLTLFLPVMFIIRKWIKIDLLLKVIPFLQSLTEIVIITSIVYTTGNINSSFSGLFMLTIISAALVNSLAGTLGVASLISIFYTYILWIGLRILGDPESSRRALEIIFSSNDAAFYSIFLHILTFFLVAFISGFLVERLKTRDRQLVDASMALKQAKLETDDILKHLNSGLITVDRFGRIIYFNRSGEEILEYKESDIKGRDFKEVFASRMPLLAENLRVTMQSMKQFQRNEIEITNRLGRQVPIGISTSLLIDDKREVRGVIAIFQDLTDAKKLEEKFRIADRLSAIGELSAAMAHEIRNPLAAISGSVEVLRSDMKLKGENLKLMDLIIRETIRLNKILTDFLLYARDDRAVFRKVELCHLIIEVFEVIKHHPSYHNNIFLQLETTESCIYVFGDEDQIKQILINLIANACDAIEEHSGRIIVNIVNKPNRVLLNISDTGPGIDEYDLPRIFDPFFSTRKNGNGLGLAIVQRLASNLNIDISVRSKKGDGTTFDLLFNQVPQTEQISSPLKYVSLYVDQITAKTS